MGNIITRFDAEGRMVGKQRAWASFSGQSEAQYRLDGWRAAIHAEDAPGFIKKWDLAREREDVLRTEHRLKRHDGVWLSFSAFMVPLPDLDGSGIREWVCVHTANADPATVRTKESELKKLIYTAAHDLRGPLSGVRRISQLLANRHSTTADEETRELFEFVDSSLKRIDKWAADLLAFAVAGLAAGEAARVPLRAMVDRAIQKLEWTIVATKTKLEIGPLPEVLAHEDQLFCVFHNLIDNAIAYRGAERPVKVTITAQQEGKNWVITVRDDGPGFDPIHRLEVFRAFKRLHGHGVAGSGLGLATCQRIINGYGGEIWVEAGLGEGAAFSFRLPVES